MSPAVVPLVILAIAVVLTLAYLSYLAERKRTETLAHLAHQLGFHFHAPRDSEHDDAYAHFELFRRGHSRYAFNTMLGNVQIDGRYYEVKMGDFVYKVTSGSGKSRSTTTYRLSYLIVHVPYRNLPSLLIRPEGFFDKLAGMIGFDDIDFESAEFSRKFYVGSNNKRFAYDVIDPRMMEYLLDSNPPAIDLEYGRCLFSDGKRRWSPEEFQSMLRWAVSFFDRWPDHVKDRLAR